MKTLLTALAATLVLSVPGLALAGGTGDRTQARDRDRVDTPAQDNTPIGTHDQSRDRTKDCTSN
ncbi:hypothetical protein ACN9JG_20735 (plasmid) [Cereibacter azotoformans]|uniref:hypothetical protein n=1 Tax=Cereibacter TaxID=1653176 RepID=UPI0011A09C75|nr:hypothetical protein [Cereibacter sediminicola]